MKSFAELDEPDIAKLPGELRLQSRLIPSIILKQMPYLSSGAFKVLLAMADEAWNTQPGFQPSSNVQIAKRCGMNVDRVSAAWHEINRSIGELVGLRQRGENCCYLANLKDWNFQRGGK